MNQWQKRLKWLLALHAMLSFTLPVLGAVYYVDAANISPSSPFTNWPTAATNIQDAVNLATAGDIVLVTNGTYQYGGGPTGQPVSNRVYVTSPILLQSVNGPSVTTIEGSNAVVRCVFLADGATLSGFTLTNGSLTTTNLVAYGGAVLCAGTNALVTNCVIAGNVTTFGDGGGIYSGRAVNCVLSNNVSSLGRGGGAFNTLLSNCVVSSNAATTWQGGGLYGGTAVDCLISNNRANHGGGAFTGVLVRCVVSQNTAPFGQGGGARSCTLTNCVLTANTAGTGGGGGSVTMVNCLVYGNFGTNFGHGSGGGVAGGTLVNCTIVSNVSDSYIGGFLAGDARNCIIYYNKGGSGGDNYNANLTNCCTTPLPSTGRDNFSQPPLFVNLVAGDLHLQPNSPCINAGNNAYLPATPGPPTNDLDGNPRIVAGTVDVGAYEFQSPASSLSYAWAQSFGFPTDGSADFQDSDGDGLNNWQEWMAGTDPTNIASAFRILAPSYSPAGVTITWQSVNTRSYYVQRATNLSASAPFYSVGPLVPGQSGTTSYTDPAASSNSLFLYRIGVIR